MALEQGAELVPNRAAASAAVPLELSLHPLPELVAHDGLVFAFVDFILVFNLADVRDVGQKVPKAVLVKRLSAALRSLARGPALVAPATAFQFPDDRE